MTMAPPRPTREAERPLPRPIRKALRGVDRRLRLSTMLGGIGRALLASSLIAAAAMALDFVAPMSGPARQFAWLIWVVVTAAMFGSALLGAALRRPSREELAAIAERSRPGGGDRLSSAVALVGLGDRAHGSPDLIGALVDRAAEEAGSIDVRVAVPLGRAARRLAVGLLAAGAVAGPSLLVPDPVGVLARRLLVPWSDPGTAGLLTIAVEPGNATIARGDPLAVSAVVRGRLGRSAPDSARIIWEDADGTSHAMAMGPGEAPGSAPDGDRSFAITLPTVDDTITYRIVSGSGRTRAFRASVVDPPRVASHRWTIAPPPYTGFEAETRDDPAGVIAWQDSRISIVATTDRRARRVSLAWPTEDGSEPEPIELEPSTDGTTWTAEVVATASGEFSIIPEDGHGIIDRSGPSGRLEVRPDAAPVVAIGEGAEAAEPDSRLLLPVASRDDLSVAGAELHYEIDRPDESQSHEGPNAGMVPIELNGLGSPEALGVAGLDLAPLGLDEGDRLSVRVRVVDNRPEPRGPNEAWSAPRPVAIVADAARHDAETLDAALGAIREALDELARRAAEDRERVGPLKVAADAARRDPSRWSDQQEADLEALAESAQELVDRLRSLAEAMQDNPDLKAFAEAIRGAAEAEAEAARAALDDARDPDDRPEDLRRAEQGLADASDRLDDLTEQFDDLAEALAARPELADLARQEADLAERADAMAAPSPTPEADPALDPEALGQLREAQEALAQALNDLMERAPGLGEAAESARAEADAASRDLEQASGDPSQSADAARSAAEAMRRAAEQLQQASGPADPASQAEQLARMLGESGGDSPSSPTDQDPSGPPSGSAEAGASGPDAPLDLRDGRAWGSLPGHLRTEILRSSPGRYHPDYAPLIRLYFQEIARASSADPGPPPPSP